MHENFKQDREQQSVIFPGPEAGLLTFESARGPVLGHSPARKAEKHRGRITLFWRVFGGSLVSIGALVAITLAQQFTSILTEVRQDLHRMHESRGELVRREEVVATAREIQANSSGVASLRERSLILEQQLRAAEADRGQLARELHELRERVAEVVGRLYTLGLTECKSEPQAPAAISAAPSPPSLPGAMLLRPTRP